MSETRLRLKPDGRLILTPTEAARDFPAPKQYQARPAAVIDAEAQRRCKEAGVGASKRALLAHSSIEFGKYQGQTLRWVLENDPGWVIYFLARYEKERPTLNLDRASNFTRNREALYEFVKLFPAAMAEVQRRIAVDKAELEAATQGDKGGLIVNFGKYAHLTWKQLLESEEAKTYVHGYLLNPSTKPRQGSRMEKVIEWLKEQGRCYNSYHFPLQ